MKKFNIKILASVVLGSVLLTSAVSNNYFNAFAFQNEKNNSTSSASQQKSLNSSERSVSVSVDSFKSFKSALLNPSVTKINVVKSIKFTDNINEGIPNRDLIINGNADKGVVIDSDMFTIYGKQNLNGMNTFSIINANIIARGTPGKDDFTDGRFFTGGEENGPNAYGWNVYAKDVKYVGARFIHAPNGTLTFDGHCEIYTNCENAWVNHVVFKSGSTYKSSNSGTGDYGAFYFNKGKGIADGTATLEPGAKTYFNLGTALQPVFTGDFYKTTIGEKAVFDVNCLGHAIWYVAGNSSYYQLGEPTFNVERGAIVNIKEVDYKKVLNAKIDKINPAPDFYTPIYYAKSGEPEVAGSLNIMPGANFYLSGSTNRDSAIGLIRGGDGFTFNIDRAKSYDIKNLAVNANVITANYPFQKININIKSSDVSSWLKTKTYGYYDDFNPYKIYDDVTANIALIGNSNKYINSNNPDFENTFLMQNLGRIKGGYLRKFNVVFDSRGGSEVPSQTINEDEKALKPEDPTKPGYTFGGWYIDLEEMTQWDFNTNITSDITLYAKWNISSHLVSFDTNGGKPSLESINVVHGALVEEPDEHLIEKDNYVLYGWSPTNNINDLWDFSNNKVTQDMTLYAIWIKHAVVD